MEEGTQREGLVRDLGSDNVIGGRGRDERVRERERERERERQRERNQ
jgi:hypothetical protein